MNRSEDANANRVAAVGSGKCEAGNGIFFAADFESAKLVRLDPMRALQRFQEGLDRGTSVLGTQILGKRRVHSSQFNIDRRGREKK